MRYAFYRYAQTYPRMHCTPLSPSPKTHSISLTLYPEATNTTPPIPQSIPILSNASHLYKAKASAILHHPADPIFSLMAHPTDSEDYILEALKPLAQETLSLYRHPYYGSLLDAALTLIRPETLNFLLLQEPSIGDELSMETLSEGQLANSLSALADIWLKHAYSGGHKDWDKPAVSFPVIKKMTLLVSSLYKAKVPEKPILDLFSEDFKAKEASKSFLDAIQGQTPYNAKAKAQTS